MKTSATNFFRYQQINSFLANESPLPSSAYHLLFVQAGKLRLKIGERELLVEGHGIVFISAERTFQVLESQKSIIGKAISFDTDYFLLCLKNQVQLCFYPFFQLQNTPLLHLSASEWANFSTLLKKIAVEHQNRGSLNDDLLTRLYLNILLLEIERLYHLQRETPQEPSSRKQFLAAQFIQSVNENFLHWRKVADYAQALFISPSYLNDAVRGATGQSASQVIQNRLIAAAKAKLIQSEATVTEIAYQLDFSDTSYFCRFFRQQTGQSPQDFRKSNHFQHG